MRPTSTAPRIPDSTRPVGPGSILPLIFPKTEMARNTMPASARIFAILWRAGVMLAAEDTGGNDARTIRFELASGRVFLRSPGDSSEKEL